jgi:hypothetical protein
MKKQILGQVEIIEIKNKKILAKVDTGAEKSSIDLSLAKKLGLTNNLWGIKKIKSSNGEEYRPVVESKLKIKNKKIPIKLTVTKRKNLKYPMLIGKDVLKRNFFIDVSK